jgi:hypothetical protein
VPTHEHDDLQSHTVAMTVLVSAPGIDALDVACVARHALRRMLATAAEGRHMVVLNGRATPVRVIAIEEVTQALRSGLLHVATSSSPVRLGALLDEDGAS